MSTDKRPLILEYLSVVPGWNFKGYKLLDSKDIFLLTASGKDEITFTNFSRFNLSSNPSCL